MAIVKVNLEAVRYLSAKALYEGNEDCKAIMTLMTYKKRSVGFTNLVNFPYYRDANSPRVLNIISDIIASKLGENWYKLVITDEGAKTILGVLRGEKVTQYGVELLGSSLEERDFLIFFKEQEALFISKHN